jgi:hypothetical protein
MRILVICIAVVIALVPITIAAGRWLERVSHEFEEAENRENE